METRNGFIVGIFNYCDRWCDTCAFTSRCRVFADTAQMLAAQDPRLKPVVDAPPLPQDIAPEPPEWMQELLEQANNAALEDAADADVSSSESDHDPGRQVSFMNPPRIPPEHQPLGQRAEDYGDWVFAWLRSHEAFAEVSDPKDPRAVVKWFYLMIQVKVLRALRGLAEDELIEQDWPSDADGSAKVALLAVERSHSAWLQIVALGLTSWYEADPFLRQLLWLRDEIERVFPNARAFVRPGLDEPDEVARLLASERR
jgi:hypothetical protein